MDKFLNKQIFTGWEVLIFILIAGMPFPFGLVVGLMYSTFLLINARNRRNQR